LAFYANAAARARVGNAVQSLKNAESVQAALEHATKLSGRSCWPINALRTSLTAYTATKAVTSAAKTTFDAALAAYRSGVGSITDATMAETQLLQAKNASTDAYSTALSAAATLALSTGLLGAPLQ
jgi:outer membrane protein